MTSFELSTLQSIEERIKTIKQVTERIKTSRDLCLQKIKKYEKENFDLNSEKQQLLSKLQSLIKLQKSAQNVESTLDESSYNKRSLRKAHREKKEKLKTKKKWESLQLSEDNVVYEVPSFEYGKKDESSVSTHECDCEVQQILANSQLSTALSKNGSPRYTPATFKSFPVIKFHILPFIF
jgi:chromosome segregation ATPase